MTRIVKIYISNFLTGLVFWYVIEKLFMGSIGIDAVGVGVATAIFLGFNLIFDIPAGILADRWSRKGVLVISALALALCSIILGTASGLPQYVAGYIFYGIYVVCTSGTTQSNRNPPARKHTVSRAGLSVVGAIRLWPCYFHTGKFRTGVAVCEAQCLPGPSFCSSDSRVCFIVLVVVEKEGILCPRIKHN